LVAKLEPGSTLEFAPQAAGAAEPFNVSGCVSVAGVRFVLRDATANINLELRGLNFGQYAGQRVEVTGTELKGVQPHEGATQVIQVTKLTRVGGSCPLPAGNASTAKSAGMSGTTKVVIAGVAIAAVAGGTALGLTAGDSESISR
jgi:hypothetical protein